MTSEPLATPAVSAIQPALRPMTSQTIARWWLSAVELRRSSASVAVATAVRKPKVISVPTRSLSIVFGTPITLTPAAAIGAAHARVPSPPITSSASSRSRRIVVRHWSVTSFQIGSPVSVRPTQ